MNKHTLEEIKEFAKNLGYEVLDKEYINMKIKMHFRCLKCGHVSEKTFDTFKYHHSCSNCNKKESKINNKSTRVKFTLDVIEKFLNEHDVELIETKLDKGVKSWMTLRCKKCGHEFKRVFYNFRENPTCPRCRENPKALPYENIKDFIEVKSNSGCKLLTTKDEYKQKRIEQPKMALCKINIQCRCGNEFEESFNTFKSGGKRQCNECSYEETGMGRRYSYEDIKKYIEIESKSGCKLLSETYKGYHKPLHLECSCGNDFYRAMSEFKSRELFKCKKCTGATIQYTYEQVYDDLKKHNIKLLSTEYVNFQTNMDIEYSCGFKANRNYSNIKRSKYKCPHCIKSGYGRDTEQLKQEIEEITNGEYELLNEYKTMNDRVLIRHIECGHIWNITPHNFLDSGNRCPECFKSKGEQKIKQYLEIKNIIYDREFIFDDLFGDCFPLRFDFAIFNNKEKTDLKCLIEYDGEFHYKPIMGIERLERQQRYDGYKNQYCKENDIKLIRIPYWKFDNIEDILNNYFNNKLNEKEGDK